LDWHHLAAQGAAARVMLLHGMHHLWEQLEDWLKLHSAWQLTETSSLGAGFAVLSRRRDGDGAQSTKSSNCSWSLWAQSMRKATTLLEAKGEFFFKYGYWGRPRGPNKRIDIWRGPPAKFLKISTNVLIPAPSKGWCLNPKGLLNGTLYHPFGTLGGSR